MTKQLFDIHVHEGWWFGLTNDSARDKISGLLALNYLTFDTTFSSRVAEPEQPKVIKETVTEHVYVCSEVGCSYTAASVGSVRAHRSRTHRVRTIKVEP